MSYVGNNPPQTTIPADDSVTSAMIVDGTITSGDMAVDPRNATNLNAGDVPLAQLDNVPAVDLTGLEDDIALLGFRVASNGSLAKYNLVDQTVDDFQDTSGVDASASTNEVRDSSGKYYKGEAASTPSISGNYDSTGTTGIYSWYKWTTATSSGTFTTDTAQDYEYLIVAGGGAGGNQGGGGAGGYRNSVVGETTGGGGSAEAVLAVAATTISGITVGAGGTAPATATSGGNSIFSSITSTGGGVGGQPPAAGGSGGGGGRASEVGGAASAPTQGYAGGQAGPSPESGNVAANYSSGGGGGAGAVGEDNQGASGPGDGGVGLTSSIDGSATFRGGGGGGGKHTSGGSNSVGGNGGGGFGYIYTATVGTDGAANTGGGGGGAAGIYGVVTGVGGAGGTGIVIIRRETSPASEGANMTLVSTTTAAQAAPTKGDIVLTYTNGAGTTTLDTDVTAEISADGGSTWTALALASEGSTGSHNIATSHDVTISSTITAPYNMAYRIKTLNQSASKTTRIQAVSLGWS